jgi:hypothetical protein
LVWRYGVTVCGGVGVHVDEHAVTFPRRGA